MRSPETRKEECTLSLRVTMQHGQKAIINGAILRFDGVARFSVENHASVLSGDMVMESEAEATTPAKRLYWAIQTAYTARSPADAYEALDGIGGLAAEISRSPSKELAVRISKVLTDVGAKDFYPALRRVKYLIDHEGVLSHMA